MTLRTPIRRISSKRLAQMGGEAFSTIAKHSKPRRKRPWLTRKAKQESVFLDPRSYVTKGGRVRLFGVDMRNLRVEVFNRSRGYCEAEKHHPLCERKVQWVGGHLAHKQHGARKTDTTEGTEWRSAVCHLIEQHNPKAVPRKSQVSSMEE